MFSVFDLPALRDTRIHIVDVGAMNLGDEIYAPLERAGRATVLGFEPVAEECAKLNQGGRAGHRYLPFAVGDGRRRLFQVCNFSMTSSLYEPNTSLLNLYQALGGLVQVVHREDLKTVRLDDIAEAREADYLKLDVHRAPNSTSCSARPSPWLTRWSYTRKWSSSRSTRTSRCLPKWTRRCAAAASISTASRVSPDGR